MRQILLMLLAVGICTPSTACTLWAAAGETAAGGSLIAKNRDWRPDHSQEVRLVRPASGHSYVALFARDGSAPGLKAGTNDQGLTVVSASASSLARTQREAQSGRHGVMRTLLEHYASLDEVEVEAGRIFPGARAAFLMLADRHGVASVEIGPDGHYALRRASSGTLSHTNHYLAPSLQDYGQAPGRSSLVRLARVSSLLQSEPSFDLARFIAISEDRSAGPEDSLWRSGREHTLASWIVRTPEQGAPLLRIVLANPGEAVRTLNFELDHRFWNAATLP